MMVAFAYVMIHSPNRSMKHNKQFFGHGLNHLGLVTGTYGDAIGMVNSMLILPVIIDVLIFWGASHDPYAL